MIEIYIKNCTYTQRDLPETIKIKEGTNLKEVLRSLKIENQYGYFSIFINGKPSCMTNRLNNRDEITIIPFMMGG